MLAALVALACRGARLGPALRHALWLVVLIKLLTPPIVVWPWSPVSLFPASVQTATNPGGLATEPRSSEPVDLNRIVVVLNPGDFVIEDFDQALGAALDQEATRLPFAAPLSPQSSAALSSGLRPGSLGARALAGKAAHWFSDTKRLSTIIVSVWVSGALVVLLAQLRCVWRCRRLCRHGQPPPGWLAEEVERLARTFKVRTPATLVVKGIASPAILCLGRPRLLWPGSLVENVAPDEWRGVVAHELAHLRRRDHWVSWLELIAACLWWWNPVFWFVRRHLEECAELACDAWVLWAVPDDRRVYAEALLEISEAVSRIAAPVPALGASTGARRSFQRRLTMILCERTACKLSFCGLIGTGLLAALALPAWSLGQDSAPPPPPPAAPAVETLPAGTLPQLPPTPAVAPLPSASYVTQPTPKPPASVVERPAPLAAPVPVPFVVELPPPAQTLTTIVAQPAQPAGSTSGSDDRDRRISDLEKKLEALLGEVRALHQGGTANWITKPSAPQVNVSAVTRRYPTATVARSGQPGEQAGLNARAHMTRNLPGGLNVQSLTRATYNGLPKGMAESLVTLLREQNGTEVDAKVDGDSLTITTTPEAQQSIGHFILFLTRTPTSPAPPPHRGQGSQEPPAQPEKK